MKREELRALGLTDEQISKVMDINGVDIEALKSDKVRLSQQLKTANDALVERDQQLTDLKATAITKDDYEAKITELQKAKTKRLRMQLQWSSASDDQLFVSTKEKQKYSFAFMQSVVELYLSTALSYQERTLSVGLTNPSFVSKWVNGCRSFQGGFRLRAESTTPQKVALCG